MLEAEICGWGPSGRNGGFVHGFWTQLASLRELVGDGAALELARAGSRILPAGTVPSPSSAARTSG